MIHTCDAGRLTIEFDINTQDEDAIEQCAFVVLVERKFEPESSVSEHRDESKRTVGCVELRFKTLSDYGEARNLCISQLDNQGGIRREYAGALNAADPNRALSR